MVSARARASSLAKSFLPERSIIVDHANWTRIPLYLFNENLCWQTDEKKVFIAWFTQTSIISRALYD